jgi:hypothetical protein
VAAALDQLITVGRRRAAGEGVAHDLAGAEGNSIGGLRREGAHWSRILTVVDSGGRR